MPNLYFDNAATSYPKAPAVADALVQGLYCQAAAIQGGQSAAEKGLELRERLCRLFHFDEPARAILTPGASFGLNMVLRGTLQKGDHCLISQMEHHSVLRTCTELSTQGIAVDRIPCNAEGFADLEAAKALIRPNTKMLMLCHASNVCGTIQDANAFGKLCAENDIFFALDAAQSAGCMPIDFAALQLSALILPAHKGLLGPTGIGAALLSEPFAAQLRPLLTGGTGSFSHLESQPQALPDRFETGTQNHPGIFAWDAALAWIEAQGVESLYIREQENSAYFIRGLDAIHGLRLLGTKDVSRRLGVFSLDFLGKDPAIVAQCLAEEYGICIRTGLHCAPAAHQTLGTYPRGSVRFSLGHYHTKEDLDIALSAINKVVER